MNNTDLLKVTILIYVILFSQKSTHVFAQEPFYSVTIAMPDKIVERNQLVNVSVYIAGMGSYNHGSIMIQSDADNLRLDTYKIHRLVASKEDIYSEQPILSDMNEVVITSSMAMGFEDIEVPSRSMHTLLGTFLLDVKIMDTGTYRLKAIFSCEADDRTYQFEDETSYIVETRWGRYGPFLITFILSVIGSNMAFFIQQRYKNKNNQKIDIKKSSKSKSLLVSHYIN